MKRLVRNLVGIGMAGLAGCGASDGVGRPLVVMGAAAAIIGTGLVVSEEDDPDHGVLPIESGSGLIGVAILVGGLTAVIAGLARTASARPPAPSGMAAGPRPAAAPSSGSPPWPIAMRPATRPAR